MIIATPYIRAPHVVVMVAAAVAAYSLCPSSLAVAVEVAVAASVAVAWEVALVAVASVAVAAAQAGNQAFIRENNLKK